MSVLLSSLISCRRFKSTTSNVTAWCKWPIANLDEHSLIFKPFIKYIKKIITVSRDCSYIRHLK